jgi:hypothetical protein
VTTVGRSAIVRIWRKRRQKLMRQRLRRGKLTALSALFHQLKVSDILYLYRCDMALLQDQGCVYWTQDISADLRRKMEVSK